MADDLTVRVYETRAEEWTADRSARSIDEVGWVAQHQVDGAVLDIGCGPGWHLDHLTAGGSRSNRVVGLDVSQAMLATARSQGVQQCLINGEAGLLPVRPQSLGGAVASRVYQHLPAEAIPLALADLHRCLRIDAPVFIHVFRGDRSVSRRSSGQLSGRLFTGFSGTQFTELLHGAGFEMVEDRSEGEDLRYLARRALTLPDTVGPEMNVLVCGLNPSIYSAEVGVGFGRPGNRFWPAALASELVTQDRDPFHAIRWHGIGMTDLVKRATRRASELTTDDYHRGLDRLERLVSWLRPRLLLFVGLAGWRATVSAKATAGLQEQTIGGRPVYLMPSTSGLNAHTQLDGFIGHLTAVKAIAAGAATTGG